MTVNCTPVIAPFCAVQIGLTVQGKPLYSAPLLTIGTGIETRAGSRREQDRDETRIGTYKITIGTYNMGHFSLPNKKYADIHCHLIHGIDDGAHSLDQSLAMARMAVADGITTIIATPHQMGAFAHNTGELVRARTKELQQVLTRQGIPLRVLPGGDVRIDTELVPKLKSGEVLSLADRKRHVLLELPHELYFPLESVLGQLANVQMVGILSHPERNQGILKNPSVLKPLVQSGCLMQVTAGSLMGTFGPACQQLAERMLQDGLVHFVATDAHGPNSRRPLLARAFFRVAEIVGAEVAEQLCCHNPARVVQGRDIGATPATIRKRKLNDWIPWRRSA